MSDRFYYIDPTGRQSGPFAQNDLVHFAKLGLVARDGRIELVGIDTQFIVADVPWLEHCIPADRTAPPLPPDARSAEPIAPEPTPFAYPHPAAALGAPPLPAAQPQLGATPTRDAFAAAATAGPDASAPLTQTARSTYLLLALLPAFVGIFGIHNIVAGYVGRGVFQLVLSLFTVSGCCIGLGAPPCLCLGLPLWLGMFVWTLVEALTVRSDARGRAFA
jgi:hypothetical protein